MARPLASLPVTFRFKPPRASNVVDLRGELPHFYDYTPMPAVGGGAHEVTLALEPGVYAYKFFLAGDEWLLDPENPRSRSRDGYRNSIVCVGGADEPLLHAPARPWVFVDDDGTLVVRAGVRRGQDGALSVRFDEGSGQRHAAMVAVAQEDEHRLFEARLPVSAARVRYVFQLESGRVVGRGSGGAEWFEVTRKAVTPPTPSWWKDAVLYTIFVDRFRRGDGQPWPALANERDRAGGDLDGVIAALPYLSDLGVTALHLTPIHNAPSAHRYDAIDPRAIDPALGGEAALSRLLEAAHARGLRVLCDMPITHVHRDFFAFRDVRERGFGSRYIRWFHVYAHPFAEGPEAGYRHYQKGQWKEPLLRTDEPEVVDFLAETFAHYAKLGVDGFRVDAAADVPLATLERIARAARAARSDIVLLGEVVPENTALYTRHALDSATDFSHRTMLLDWLVKGTLGVEAYAQARACRRFDRGGPGYAAAAFTATHDQPRFRSVARHDGLARIAELLTLFGAAIPAMYYGDEVALVGNDDATQRHFDDAWPDRAPMVWDERGRSPESARWLDDVRRAVRLRRDHAVLRRGDEHAIPPRPRDHGQADTLLVLRRTLGDEVIDVCVNAGADVRTMELPSGAPRGTDLLFTAGDSALLHDALRLGPHSVAVVRRVISEADRALWHSVRASTADLARAAFRASLTESGPLPSRLYLTVTERCNLRCGHCITAAPEKTAQGTARSIEPWLLDALHEPFAAADYIGFVHGGESLLAPIFPEVLAAIQAAKRSPGARPANIHLLSNGMLLTPERIQMILRGGVNSVSVSLDGGTEVTNDSLRLGGRMSAILRNLETLVRERAARGLDLRIGISTVITRSNAHELPELGRLARALGVDWLKVEELFPCTPRARHEMIAVNEPSVVESMAKLHDQLSGSAVVLVDHRDPPRGCACDAAGDPQARLFRQADDFANRTVFQPCRMEWEQACIDPDGTVRPVSYEREPIGNLAEASLLDLWNGGAMTNVRSMALRRTRASRRRACPH